jgi:DNA-damage-inducible protein D
MFCSPPFRDARHVDDDGIEFWLARELSPLLGYRRWDNFETAMGRAKIACAAAEEEVSDHFRDVTKWSPSVAERNANRRIAS